MDIGRPAREETIEYYHPYIDLVPGGDIRRILEQQRGDALAFLRRIPEEKTAHSYAPDKWTVSEVVGHLNDSERLFAMRAFWFARANDAPMPSWHSDAAVKISKSAERSLASHIEEFAAIRAATLSLFDNLPDEAWTRGGIASDNPFSVRALAYIAAGHVIHHLDILEKRYL